ncbi:sensor histidine kinase [Flavobacterium sp.]|uniref:ATP-binding protein n=1 Tax=Flavobacterium sp. TaxID=239 RepID=UPI00286BD3C9|nr:sensor histidine kinase [Flavobacterium sp.]
MKKYFLILLLPLVFFTNCNKTKNTGDSDKQTIDSLSDYFFYAQNKSLPKNKRIRYNNKAFLIAQKTKNSQESRNSLINVLELYYDLKSNNEFKKAYKVIVEKSIESKDTINIAKSYNLLGNFYIDSGKNDSAYYFLLKSEKLFAKKKDSLNLGKNYIDKAFVQLYESDYSNCELSSIQALNFYKNQNRRQKEYDAFNLVGICSNELKNYDNAIVYHKKALDYVNRYEVISKSKTHYRSSTLNNIGYVYLNLNNYKEAINNFNQALSEKNLLIDNPYVYSAIIDNLAYSKFKIGDYTNLPSLFFTSLKIREKNGLFSGVIANKIHLSEFYLTLKDSINSQKFANEALQLAKKTKISGDLLGSLKQLSLVDHKNATQYSNEYIKISDSLQLEERKSKDKFARIAFETDEIIQEKDKLTEQNRTLLYFFIGTLFLGILLFVIRTQRAKNRELLLKQQQQKVNEEIYNLMISQQATIEENRVKEKKRIAQELHDGVLGRLFGARLNLDSLNRFNDEDSINSRFDYLAELKNIEQDIREISHDLNREKYVLINNFVAIVSNLLEEQANSFEARLTSALDESIQWDKVSNAVKINLYRILQESLQNINKYANAKHISVEFKNDNGLILLTITDDGIGFDVNTKKKGIGLQNMQSRVDECEGTFDIKSKKGKGTITIVSIPIEKKAVEVP